MKQSQFYRALWYGILGALFFAFTFIFNRSMTYFFCLAKERIIYGISRYSSVTMDLVSLEYSWFWTFLWSTFHGFCLW